VSHLLILQKDAFRNLNKRLELQNQQKKALSSFQGTNNKTIGSTCFENLKGIYLQKKIDESFESKYFSNPELKFIKA
jgi:hypothetical protein